MKRIIKYFLRKIGYEIRPLNLYGANNSIEYNAPDHADSFYSNPKLYQEYVQNNVAIHVKNLFTLLEKKGLDLRHKKVVDVSCGTGHCMLELKSQFPGIQLTGTEYSLVPLRLAADLVKDVTLVELDLSKSALPQLFDFVLCQQVLEHIPDYEAALQHLWQMTAPGGYLLLTIPDGRLDSFAGHIHFWSKEGFSLLLNKYLNFAHLEVGHLQDDVSLYALLRK